ASRCASSTWATGAPGPRIWTPCAATTVKAARRSARRARGCGERPARRRDPGTHPGPDRVPAGELDRPSHPGQRCPEARRHEVRDIARSEEHTSELQSLAYLVCRLLLEKKKKKSILTCQIRCIQHT